jgi:monomeric sarcosine oxidase
VAGFDVIVLGLGGTGSAAAAHLAARGARVLGLDRTGPAPDRGHRGARILRQSWSGDPAHVPLLLRSYELWEQLRRESGDDVVQLTGGLYFGAPDSALVTGSLRTARQWDLPHEVLDAEEIHRRFPTFRPRPDEVGLFEAAAGFVRPEATVHAHRELAARRGAELHVDEPVVSWTATAAGGVAVTTAAGSHEADRLVLCPGAWAPRLLARLGLPLTVERQVEYWFQPLRGVLPHLPARQPVYVHEDAAGTRIHGFPALDGPAGGAQVGFSRRGTVCTPETVDRDVHPDEVTAMADHLADVLPTLPGAFLSASTCLDTTTPDQHVVLGPHPQAPQVTLACGFRVHDVAFVPVVGEILADLATTGTTAHPIGLFDPRRPALAG